MSVKAVVEELLILRISPPGLFRTDGYAENWLVVVLYGKAGAGKSTIAHALLHMADRSEETVTARGRKIPVRFLPIGLMLEGSRLHSYACPLSSDKNAHCPFVSIVSTAHGGNVQQACLAIVESRLKQAARKGQGESILIPFITVDTATLLTQGTNQMGDRWRANMAFLGGLHSLSPYGIVILLAQEREQTQVSGPYRVGRPALADSILHQAHLKVHATRVGSETTSFRLHVYNVNLAEPRVPSSPFEITRDTLMALIHSGEGEREGRRKGQPGQEEAGLFAKVSFGGWAKIYVPR